jgi:hypothetical protein
MKKKLILGFVAAMFAAVTLVNINLAMKVYNGDVSLESITVMAQAQIGSIGGIEGGGTPPPPPPPEWGCGGNSTFIPYSVLKDVPCFTLIQSHLKCKDDTRRICCDPSKQTSCGPVWPF